MADNYINLGEIQAATAPTSETPASQPGSSPASLPPSAPKSTPGASAPGSAPGSAPPPSNPTPPAQASVFPAAQAAPPPPPAENALAAVSAASPPKDTAPVAINPVHAPQLKLFEDVNFDSDGKSTQGPVGKKGSASDPRKRKNNGTKEDDEEYKKPKKYYIARALYGSCFSMFIIILIIWGLVAAVALNAIQMDFIENLIMNNG